MALPTYPRVIYQQNPLAEVVCQVRFPAIAQLDTQRPMEFWNRVREQYPFLETKDGLNIDLPIPLPPDIAARLPRHKSHDFISADDLWMLSLTKDFLALTCRNYERWEEFKAHFVTAFDALQQIYQPASSPRIGLRYLDVIQRSQLGLDGVAWSELLTGRLVGELAAPEIAGDIQHVARELVFLLRDSQNSKVHIRHGFVQVAGSEEGCYLIDSDFYTDEQTEISDVLTILDAYNQYARRLFRWCISPRLHEAMGPVGV